MSYKSDREEFERKYGKGTEANSIRVSNLWLEKVRNQDKWILYYNGVGRIKWFNQGVGDLCALEVEKGYLPQIKFILTKKELKQLKIEVEKRLKRS